MREEFTWGMSMNPQYDDLVKYAKSRITSLASAFNDVVAGKKEAVVHHPDWMDDEYDEYQAFLSRAQGDNPEYDGLFAGICFIHLFEEYVVCHNEISNQEKKQIFNAIYKVAFAEGMQNSRLTEAFFLEKQMSFNAYVMYRDLESLALHAFYSVCSETCRTYAYLRPQS